MKFCIEPKSLFDIMQHVNLKARKNVMNVYINPMLAAGVLKMTEPDNPTSRNQMYVTAEEAPETWRSVSLRSCDMREIKKEATSCRSQNDTHHAMCVCPRHL